MVTNDLIILGEEPQAIAAAFYFLQNYQDKNLVLVTRGDILKTLVTPWVPQLVGRQLRHIYSQKYLIDFALLSDKYWDQLDRNQIQENTGDRILDGTLHFGIRDKNTQAGNILQANAVVNDINYKREFQHHIDRLYLENISPISPNFFQVFKEREQGEWNKWSALYQPKAGIVNVKQAYDKMVNFIKQKIGTRLTYIKNAVITSFEELQDKTFEIKIEGNQPQKGARLLIADGIYTPYFLKKFVKEGGHIADQCSVNEFALSYFKVLDGKKKLQESTSSFYNFLDGIGVFGNRHHDWDAPPILNQNGEHFTKIGTTKSNQIQYNLVPTYEKPDTIAQTDQRVQAAIQYVRQRSQTLQAQNNKNISFPFYTISYPGRPVILDYLNRTQQRIVVLSGGTQISHAFPVLGKLAINLVLKTPLIKNAHRDQDDLVGRFLIRTRFPIRQDVLNKLNNQKPIPKEKEAQFDVVAVGAGCAGLYSIYRLNNQKPNLKLALFELSDRISGRLLSIKFQGTCTPMELGGMRYKPKNHPIFKRIVDKQFIPNIDFAMSGDPIQTYSLRAFLRNDYFSKNQWQDSQNISDQLMTSYRIKGDIVGMTSGQIKSYSFYLIVNLQMNKQILDRCLHDWRDKIYIDPQNKLNTVINLSFKQWNNIKPRLLVYYPFTSNPLEIKQLKLKPLPLYKFGFQNIIESQFGHQAASFVAEQSGYTSSATNSSYLQSITTFGNPQYRTLAGGYDMFNYNLAHQILNKNSGIQTKYEHSGIYLNHRLVNIDGSKGNYNLHFQVDGKSENTIVVKAKQIILGMPNRSIQLLANNIKLLQQPIDNYQYRHPDGEDAPEPFINDPPIAPQSIFDLIKSTESVPALKIIMNFDRNWWDPILKINNDYSRDHPYSRIVTSINQMRGVSVTDLPVRQTLYFSTATQHMILASYNDMVSTDYWQRLDKNFNEPFQASQFQIQNHQIQERLSFDQQKNLNTIWKAKKVMVLQVIRQLQLIHSTKINISWVRECLYQNWAIDPFGGGYHDWNAGYDLQAIIKCVRKPWKEQDIHIVGQALSNTVGWVEGALQVTEHLLKESFGVDYLLPPDQYYIGF